MPERLSRRRRRRRLWILLATALVIVAVAYLVLRAAGCFSHPLDVTVTVHNAGTVPLNGLSLDQIDGPAHAVIPEVAPGATVSVPLRTDDAFGKSSLQLVDDVTGRDYLLPPAHFQSELHGRVDVDVARPAHGAELTGRARCATDAPGGDQGWQVLRRAL